MSSRICAASSRRSWGWTASSRWRSWGPGIWGSPSPTIRVFAARDSESWPCSTRCGREVGQESRSGVRIYDIQELREVAHQEGITIAVIAVPAASAQQVVSTVVEAGIKAVLNFSPGALRVPPDVKLKSVDLTVSLESLSFYLASLESADRG